MELLLKGKNGYKASVMVRGEGLLSFCNDCGNEKVRCNGRSEQGKEALSVCAQGLCKDAKPTKHTQTLTLRKAGGIVRFWEEWCGNPSGSRPNSFGRQHLTFDKGGKCGGARRSDGCAFEKVVEMERFDATGGASKARKP